METNDNYILSFFHKLESLEGAFSVIDQEVFEQQFKKIILKYDFLIGKKKRKIASKHFIPFKLIKAVKKRVCICIKAEHLVQVITTALIKPMLFLLFFL